MRSIVRHLVRSPGFTAVAVLTLAIGLGGLTAVFSAVDRVLLQPLASDEPGRLPGFISITSRRTARRPIASS